MGTYSSDRLGAVKARGGSLGVTAPLGVGELRAGYSQYRIASGITNPTTNKLAFGYVHNLSKRTALYTSYAGVGNSRGATQALNGAATGAGCRWFRWS